MSTFCFFNFFGSFFIYPPGGSLNPKLELVGGSDGRRAAWLDVFQVAGVTQQVAVKGVAAVALFIIQLHLTVLQQEYKNRMGINHPLFN